MEQQISEVSIGAGKSPSPDSEANALWLTASTAALNWKTSPRKITQEGTSRDSHQTFPCATESVEQRGPFGTVALSLTSSV